MQGEGQAETWIVNVVNWNNIQRGCTGFESGLQNRNCFFFLSSKDFLNRSQEKEYSICGQMGKRKAALCELQRANVWGLPLDDFPKHIFGKWDELWVNPSGDLSTRPFSTSRVGLKYHFQLYCFSGKLMLFFGKQWKNIQILNQKQ